MNRYKTDLLDLRCMDCMELLRDTPDKHYSLCIVDPPYGIGEDGGNHKHKATPNKAWANPKQKGYAKKNWDSSPPSQEYFSEIKRVSRNQIIWGANHFIDNLSGSKSTSCWIAWYKAGQNPNTDFADGELAWCSFKTAVKFVMIPWIGFGAVNLKEQRIHPTQKPVALYKWLLHNYAKPGDKILDTHGGSMGIAIACHYAGYNLTLTEMDPDYFKAGVERVKRETAQRDMFTEGLI